VPNWPQMPAGFTATAAAAVDNNSNSNDSLSRRTNEPESPNVSWFFEKDIDQVRSYLLIYFLIYNKLLIQTEISFK